jgi:hypothetical protein
LADASIANASVQVTAEPAAHLPALAGHSLVIIVKLKDHDIRVPIIGMGRVVAISRDIRLLVITTTNPHDLERTGRPAPLLDLVNCVE